MRDRGVKHLRVIYSPELPAKPEALEAPPPGRRSVPASLVWVPGCAGLMMAGGGGAPCLGRNGPPEAGRRDGRADYFSKRFMMA